MILGPYLLLQETLPFFAKIDDCKMSALDCKCHVPWHERDLWERRAFSQYKLPARLMRTSSLWQSQSLTLPGGVSETIWVQQGVSDSVWTSGFDLFSFGTIPQSHRASLGRELLSGSHMRTMFHDSWMRWCDQDSEDE